MTKENLFDRLWERARERGEFPALQRALTSIVSVMEDDSVNNAQLATAVLGDFTLTQKVLRLANSAIYAPYARDVTTVSRALMILGTATVAYTAMSIQLLDTFEELASSRAEAAEELAQAAFAGKLAREFAAKSCAAFAEESAVSTLLFQLPRLLTVFYLPEEWARIRDLLNGGMTEEAAFLEVLGVTPDELSREAFREWTLPHTVIDTAQAQPSEDGSLVTTHHAWLACLAGLSTRVSQELNRGGEDVHRRVRALMEDYAPSLGQDATELERLALELFESELAPQEVQEAQSAQVVPVTGKPLNAEMRLDQALSEVLSAADEADAPTLTQMVLESMMQGLGLVSCVAFFHIPEKKVFEARLGFGARVKDNLARMSFEDAYVPDVFHVTLTQGRPVFLDDLQAPQFSPRIPAWHKSIFPDARSAVLLPIKLNDRSIGLLYGNWGSHVCMAGMTATEFEHLNVMRSVLAKALGDAAKTQGGAFLRFDSGPSTTRS
ncbi:HDOD domain-containing protein [Burkholderia multivorans]|jgi:HD-like signal output (HDOD) protein|uniref:HDOD domain-containing protein n=1 Tax=Burkholderia multivorans TaxID=87883 RepID=UPI001C22F3DE|nr:HDOD domain-containing protein [Burkholderia multivorans]MBU9200107.1 HDOD domain-containing protein [Burkholderia multivorans]MDN8078771.1 HDOD domain-containing protein [Burkholderia multivorans]